MRKKILTLEDLYDFVKSNNSISFSAEESGYQLAVQVPATFELVGSTSDDTLLFGRARAFHLGKNRNGSNVTSAAALKAMKHMAYKPLLANFCEYEDENGNVVKDFTSHDMEIDEENDSIRYIEKQIGCITADEPWFEDYRGKKYVCCNIAVPKQYTDACEILERKNGTKVSIELSINEMSYDVKSKSLLLDDVTVMGLTCLGINPENGEDVQEGMVNSRLDLYDFSQANNSIFSSISDEDKNKLIEMQNTINEMVSRFSIKESSKEGGNTEMSHFEELLKQYGLTVEDITFEYENMSDEELDVKFEELFKKDDEDGEEPSKEGKEPDDEDFAEDNDDDNENDDDEDEKFTKSFSLSHDDVRCALYQLLGDGWNYIVSVYDDKFIYQSDEDGLFYSQAYSKDNVTDMVSFVGERNQVFNVWLTSEEKASLDSMKQNYPVMEQKLAGYEKAETDALKAEVLANEMYANFIEEQEFVDVKSKAEAYSVEELKTQCELAFAKCVQRKGCFSYNPKRNTTIDTVAMFGDFNTSKPKASFLDDLHALATQKK